MEKMYATGLLLIATASSLSLQAKESPRPNILFCIADDASYHHFGANGCPWVETPAFDRIAREGLLFSNCYTPNAKSAPSRACVLTGRFSWQLKEAGNHVTNFPAEFKVFTEALSENGYEVAFTGKGWAPGNPGLLNGEPRRLTGRPFQRHKTTPPTRAMNASDYAANFADFLDHVPPDRPWFFWFGATEPHRAYEYGSGVSKGGKNIGMIDRVPAFWPDNEVVRNDLLDYAYEIEYFDSHIGKMIDQLQARGLLENTLVVVTSDNGMPFPRSKANNYEYSHHMPLAMMWKNGIENPGRVIDDFVSFVDFAPTFLDAAGVGWARSGMQSFSGGSLCGILRSKKSGFVTRNRDHVLLGRERDDYGRPFNQGYPIRGIIRDGFLYIANLKPELYPAGNPETGYLDVDGSPTKTEILNLKREGKNGRYYDLSMGLRPGEELYDLKKDPDCVVDLARKDEYAARKEALRKELFGRLRSQRDPRMMGDGDVFDRYPFDSPDKWDFFERVTRGQVKEPWKQTRWVSPTDYPSYREKAGEESAEK